MPVDLPADELSDAALKEKRDERKPGHQQKRDAPRPMSVVLTGFFMVAFVAGCSARRP